MVSFFVMCPTIYPVQLYDRAEISSTYCCVCVCVRVCAVVPLIVDVRLVDAPAGATREEGHTGFLYFPSAVLALIFIARRVQPFLSLVGGASRVLCTHVSILPHLLGILFCEENSQFM